MKSVQERKDPEGEGTGREESYFPLSK